MVSRCDLLSHCEVSIERVPSCIMRVVVLKQLEAGKEEDQFNFADLVHVVKMPVDG